MCVCVKHPQIGCAEESSAAKGRVISSVLRTRDAEGSHDGMREHPKDDGSYFWEVSVRPDH